MLRPESQRSHHRAAGFMADPVHGMVMWQLNATGLCLFWQLRSTPGDVSTRLG